MSRTDTMSVYFRVKGAKQAESDLKKLGHRGSVALNGITASTKPVSSALIALNSTVGKLNSSFAIFGGLAAGYLGFQGIRGSLSGIIDTNTEVQKLYASLETVEKSSENAKRALNIIDELAVHTPYAINSLTQAWIKLKALGLEPSREALISYGNTSSAMGKDIMQFIEAIADASTMEFERLKEFGIKARQQKDTVSFTFQGITTTVAKNSADIEQYLRNIGDTEFAGVMQRQMDTIGGATSNLADNLSRMQRQVGDAGFNDELTNLYKTLGEFVSSNSEAAEGLGKSLATVTKGITKIVENIDILGDAVIAFGGFKALQIGARLATASMIPLRTAIASTALSIRMVGPAATAGAVAMTGLGVAARGLSAAVGILGGPIGLITIAAFAIYEFCKASDDAVDFSGKYAKELETLENKTKDLTTATTELNKVTQQGKKLALLDDLAEAKEDLKEIQKDIKIGLYDDGWDFTGWGERIGRMVNPNDFDYWINQLQQERIGLAKAHKEILKLGEISPEYRDQALAFDEKVKKLKAIELHIETVKGKLNALNQPITPNLGGGNDGKNELSEIEKKANALERLMQSSEKANSSVDKLEKSLNTDLDPNSWVKGALEGFEEVKSKSQTMAESTKQAVTGAFDSMGYALGNFVTTGKLDFSSFASSIISDLVRIQTQQSIVNPLSDFISGFFGSSGSSTKTTSAGVNHAGGNVGSGVSRIVPMEAFIGAPRYHSGGSLRQDEVPLIGQKGELLLGRQPTQALIRALRHPQTSGTGNVIVNINHKSSGEHIRGETQVRQGQNGINMDIVVEEVEGKLANNINRNKGSLNSTLRKNFAPNRANL